ncbi:hypothetical protein LTR53_008371 [Teratosphaeriaceae sp. CCFEE 6253]|nr:hypothetical protein LTR53_008371 [Teratosphaeriaceae sp. CCFEE 6253]
MDPFSSEGELLNIHTAFVQGQHKAVVDDYSTSDFSQSNRLPVQMLQYRAQCALGQYDEVIEKFEQALQLLAKHSGSLDAIALIVQIHLMQNRTDLAIQQAKSARSFAQDALLVNLAESWVGMRQGGEQYQKAFYVFEELAQAPSSASAMSLVAQAVSELHLGRLEEAETALDAALEAEPSNSTVLANRFVLDAIAGRNTDDARAKLENADKEHEILADILAKREAFQAATAKYNPKFEP